MKIVLSLLSKHLGGMENSFLDYIKVLKRKGHDVVVITHKLAPYLQDVRYYTHSVHVINPLGYYDVLTWYHASKILGEVQPDIIIAHGNRAISLLRKISLRRCPVIAINHSNNLKRSIGSSFLITVNRGMKESAIDLGQHPDRCDVIPNMIDMDAINFKSRNYHSPPVIGAMGRFTAEKGFITFIHALGSIYEKGIDFRAIIAGDGVLKPKLEEMVAAYGIKEKVIFPGWIYKKEDFYKSIDIMCIPSRYETFGMVILEAALHSIPIVSTPTDGATSILTNGVHGVLTTHVSPASVAAGLIKAISHEDQMKECSKRCFEHIKANYSLDVIGNKIEEIIARAA